MKRLEILAQQREEARLRYEAALQQQTEAAAELKDIQAQRAVARKAQDTVTLWGELLEEEGKANKSFQILEVATRQAAAHYAIADGSYNEFRMEILGLYSSAARYEKIVYPGLEKRIAELEAQLQQWRGQLGGEKRKEEKLREKIASLTDLTKEELQADDPQDVRIGVVSRRGRVFARL